MPDAALGERAAFVEGIGEAIVQEKRVKAWKRAWKVTLIETDHPDWADLFDRIV